LTTSESRGLTVENTDVVGSALSWRAGVYGGAVLGGVTWGLIALLTIGASGDQVRHNAVDGGRLLVAALACFGVGVVGLCLLRFGRNRILRALSLALVVAPVSGWWIVASLSAQHFVGWA
jgi:hypothetical protein